MHWLLNVDVFVLCGRGQSAYPGGEAFRDRRGPSPRIDRLSKLSSSFNCTTTYLVIHQLQIMHFGGHVCYL